MTADDGACHDIAAGPFAGLAATNRPSTATLTATLLLFTIDMTSHRSRPVRVVTLRTEYVALTSRPISEQVIGTSSRRWSNSKRDTCKVFPSSRSSPAMLFASDTATWWESRSSLDVTVISGSSSRGGSGQPAGATLARARLSALVHGCSSSRDAELWRSRGETANVRHPSTSFGYAVRCAFRQTASDGGVTLVLPGSGRFQNA